MGIGNLKKKKLANLFHQTWYAGSQNIGPSSIMNHDPLGNIFFLIYATSKWCKMTLFAHFSTFLAKFGQLRFP